MESSLLSHVIFRSRFLLLRSPPDTTFCQPSSLWLLPILAPLHLRLVLWQWRTTLHLLAGPPSTPAAGHYLPGNPLPYLAPSATHQPELLLLSWMIATLHTLVADLQHHPILTDPIPHPSSFTDQQAYRLYLQLRNTLRRLVTITNDLCQGIRILQFLPGSPGSPGHYRMDPVARFPPSATTNFLSSPMLPPTHQPTTLPPPQHRLTPRARSRSRDRPPATTTTTTTTTSATPPTPLHLIIGLFQTSH